MSKKSKFNPKAKCSKCGDRDISTQYCDKQWPADCRLPLHDQGTAPHIHRYCLRCAYEWYETPLDSKRERGQ